MATLHPRFLLLVPLSMVAWSAPASAQFLKYDSVEGESTRSGGTHEDQIDVLSWSWGAANAGGNSDRPLIIGRVPNAQPGARAQLASGTLTVSGLFNRCRVGMRYPGLTFDDGAVVYRLRDATVTECVAASGDVADRPTEQISLSVSGATNDSRPTEQVTLSTAGDADDRPTEEVAFYYNKISFRYARGNMTMKGKKILQN